MNWLRRRDHASHGNVQGETLMRETGTGEYGIAGS